MSTYASFTPKYGMSDKIKSATTLKLVIRFSDIFRYIGMNEAIIENIQYCSHLNKPKIVNIGFCCNNMESNCNTRFLCYV